MLSDIEPPVWRKISVPGTITLAQLSRAVQSAMGWEGQHLYDFIIGGETYGDPSLEAKNATRIRVQDVVNRRGRTFQYRYDFGDDWVHQIKVVAIRPMEPGETVPRLHAGGRACPPEDVGGVPGYYNLLEILSDPTHPEHHDMLEWLGGSWDPENFAHESLQHQLMATARRGRWNKTNP